MRTLSAVLLASLVSSSFAGVANAQSDRDRAGARAAAEAGADAFDQGRFAEALDLFTRAEQLVHAPTHRLYMARANVKLGKLVEARENYLSILAEKLPANAPAPFKRAQAEAEAELDAVEARLAYVTITLQGAKAETTEVSMDGSAVPAALVGIPFPVNPGEHVFVAQSGSAKSNEVRLDLAEGRKQSVTLTLDATAVQATDSADKIGAGEQPGAHPALVGGEQSVSAKPASGPPALAYVLLGAGVLAAGAGTYFVIASGKTRDEADEIYECRTKPGGCSEEQKEEVRDKDKAADLDLTLGVGGLIVGGLGIAGGVTLLLVGGSGGGVESTGSRPRMWIDAAPGSVHLNGTF